MATASRTVEQVEVKTLVEREVYTLQLSKREVQALLTLTGAVSGDILTLAGITESIFLALNGTGVTEYPRASDVFVRGYNAFEARAQSATLYATETK